MALDLSEFVFVCSACSHESETPEESIVHERVHREDYEADCEAEKKKNKKRPSHLRKKLKSYNVTIELVPRQHLAPLHQAAQSGPSTLASQPSPSTLASQPSPSTLASQPNTSTLASQPPSVFKTDSFVENILSQLCCMQDVIAQILTNETEIQKQILDTVAVQVEKEERRIEEVIVKSIENTQKAATDALWDRTRAMYTKQEKLIRDQSQHSGLVTNGFEDILSTLEKSLKTEASAVASAVVHSVSPVIEKTVSTAINEAFQRDVADKSVDQLKKSISSNLVACVAREMQSQFQRTGTQALKEALRSSMEATVIPAFEMSCKAMFDRVDATFQKGMFEHTSTALSQVESAHPPLASALRDAGISALYVTETLRGELTEGQRKLVALTLAGAPMDPMKVLLSSLLHAHNYEEAFTAALQSSDAKIVFWLCSQVDLPDLLKRNPLPLSQGILLSLLQQLVMDIGNETAHKLGWMMAVVERIRPLYI